MEGQNVTPPSALEAIAKQSKYYGDSAGKNGAWYFALKGIQLVLTAAIPVVSVTASGDTLKYTDAILGALIGIAEGAIQFGQFQQNWLLHRATREALKREDRLRLAKAGPYKGADDAELLYVERTDAIISGEASKWLSLQDKQTAGQRKEA